MLPALTQQANKGANDIDSSNLDKLLMKHVLFVAASVCCN